VSVFFNKRPFSALKNRNAGMQALPRQYQDSMVFDRC
jgi:hypothetical protein